MNALLFSAGIGENSALARSLICSGLTKFGVKLNPDANQKAVGVQADISAPDSKVRVLVSGVLFVTSSLSSLFSGAAVGQPSFLRHARCAGGRILTTVYGRIHESGM